MRNLAGVAASLLVAGAVAGPAVLAGTAEAAGTANAATAPSGITLTATPNGIPGQAVFTVATDGTWTRQPGSEIIFRFANNSAEPIFTQKSSITQVYDIPGTYTATVTETDTVGDTHSAAATVTVGNEILPEQPVRDYSHTVPAHGTVQLSNAALHINGLIQNGALVTVTVTSPRKAGYVTVGENGKTRPSEAAVQFGAGQAASNVVLANLSNAHQYPNPVWGPADFYNGSDGPITLTVNTIGADVAAYAGDLYGHATADTFTRVRPADALAAAMVAGNHHVAFAVAGHYGVPASAGAVVLAITASSTAAAGHFTTYAQAQSAGQAPGAYWAKGDAATGLAVVPVAEGNAVIANVSGGAARFTAQVVGYYQGEGTGAYFLPAGQPVRILSVKVAARHVVKLAVSGKNGVAPAGTSAVTVNLTASGSAASGGITVYPDGVSWPGTVGLNYAKGGTAESATIVPVGNDGAIDLDNSGTKPVWLQVDLTGSYAY